MGPPFHTIFFDFDCTLCTIEGIDELSRWADKADQLVPLTEAAMEGVLPLESIYGQRLEIIRPGQYAIERLARRYGECLVDGSQELVRRLHGLGKQVHIVSGGIRQAILPVSKILEIPDERVHAVDLVFDETGAYAGYDTSSPLTRCGGKPAICERTLGAGQPAALIGDGITDLEVASIGVVFIGFGGVAHRERVAHRARHYLDGPSLLPAIDLLLTPQERDTLEVRPE